MTSPLSIVLRFTRRHQFWPLLIGAGVAATLVGGRFAYTAVQRIALNRAAVGGVEALSKKFYDGGFEGTMTRREAALVLGCRCVTRADLFCISRVSSSLPARSILAPSFLS